MRQMDIMGPCYRYTNTLIFFFNLYVRATYFYLILYLGRHFCWASKILTYTVCPRSLDSFYSNLGLSDTQYLYLILCWLLLDKQNLPLYCMSRKSCPILYSKLSYKMSQDFLDIQNICVSTNFNAELWF